MAGRKLFKSKSSAEGVTQMWFRGSASGKVLKLEFSQMPFRVLWAGIKYRFDCQKLFLLRKKNQRIKVSSRIVALNSAQRV